jgi:tetratricopeptide (TPR) repeat protein
MGAVLSRLGKETNAEKWFRNAIEIFERPEGRAKLPGETASQLQAMSQAYAAIGNTGRAIALLNEAISKSRMVKADIFSSLKHRNISRKEFVRETRELLKQFMKRAPKSLGIHPAWAASWDPLKTSMAFLHGHNTGFFGLFRR